MEKGDMIKKMIAAGIDLETALDLALGAADPKEKPKDPEGGPKDPEEKPKDPKGGPKDPKGGPKDPEEKPAPAGISQEMGEQLLAAITKLTGAVQRSNVLNFGTDDDGETQQDKVDKMLTRFLSGEKGGSK